MDRCIVGLPNTAGTACHVLTPILLVFYSIDPLRDLLVFIAHRVKQIGNGSLKQQNVLLFELSNLFDQLDRNCQGAEVDTGAVVGGLYSAMLSDLGIEARSLGDATTAISKIFSFLRKPKNEQHEVNIILSAFVDEVLGTGRMYTRIQATSAELRKQRIKQLKTKPMAVPLTVVSSSNCESEEKLCLEDCIESYLAAKPVDGYEWMGTYTEEDLGDEITTDEANSAEQWATRKSFHIESLPNWWLLHLDRFTFQNGKAKPTTQQIEIPLVHEQHVDGEEEPAMFVLKGAVLYAEAVSDIEEDEENGHYLTLVPHNAMGGSEDDASWSLINDDTVTTLSEVEARTLLRGSDYAGEREGEEVLNTRAVLLLFERKNAVEQLRPILQEAKARLNHYFDNLVIEDNEADVHEGVSLIGKRLRVKWSKNKFYAGTITHYDENNGKHTVLYDDGDVKSYTLAKKTIEWE